MKTAAAGLAAAAIIAAFVLLLDADLSRNRSTVSAASFNTPAAAAPIQPPRFGWQTVSELTFPLAINERRELQLPRRAKLRIEVNAENAVSISGACDLRRVMKGSTVCTVPTDAPNVVISDERANPQTGAQAISAAASLLSLSTAARTLSPSSTTISVLAWECIENCPVVPRAPDAQ